MSTSSHTSARDSLQRLAAERILVLDGAMGTMIQELKLDEADYRGARFAAWNREVRGNNDLLNLSQPDAIRDIHLAYFRAGADIVSTNTFSSTVDRAGRLRHARRRLRAELRGRAAGARGRRPRGDARTAARASSPARSGRPTAPRRSRRTSPIRASAPSPSTSCARPMASRSAGLLDGGADLLLIETIFDTLNAKAAIYAIAEQSEARGVDVPVMISGTITDRSGRMLSGQTPEAFWNSVRHAAPFSVGSTARSAPRRCARISPSSRASPTRWSAPIRTPACRTSSATTTRARSTWPACSASSPTRASSTSSAAAAAPRPSTSAPSPRRCAASRRARFPKSRRCCGCPGSSRSRSRRKFPSSTSASAPTSPARPSSAS